MRLIIGVSGLIRQNNRYLFTKRISRHDRRYHDIWQIPGGGLRTREHLLDCLHRELSEELGIKIKNPRFIPKIHDIFRDNYHFIFFYFLCDMIDDKAKITLNHEASEYAWFNHNEIMGKPSFAEVPEIVALADKIS